jgi:hypothetical protein
MVNINSLSFHLQILLPSSKEALNDMSKKVPISAYFARLRIVLGNQVLSFGTEMMTSSIIRIKRGFESLPRQQQPKQQQQQQQKITILQILIIILRFPHYKLIMFAHKMLVPTRVHRPMQGTTRLWFMSLKVIITQFICS